jgi:plasmid stabilization system protein ParE
MGDGPRSDSEEDGGVTWTIQIDPEAREEMEAAYDFYESKRRGWGSRFVDRVQYEIERIQANPMIHAEVHRDVRKAVVRQFPFVLIYRIESTVVRIVAVFHTSRDPGAWRKRVS